jgi:hypothetical protein
MRNITKKPQTPRYIWAQELFGKVLFLTKPQADFDIKLEPAINNVAYYVALTQHAKQHTLSQRRPLC